MMRWSYVASSSRGKEHRPPTGSAVQLTLDLGWPFAAPAAPAVERPARRAEETREREGLQFVGLMRSLVADIAAKVPALSHIDPEKLAFSLTRARSRSKAGTYAFIVPMRFEGGANVMQHGRRTYRMPRLALPGGDALYVMYFLYPRYFNLPRQRKLHTVFHELYHIGGSFDGDLRRFAGRQWAHGACKGQFDGVVAQLVEEYLERWGSDDPAPARFLKHSWGDLTRLFGGVRAPAIVRPRPLPI